MKDHLTDLDTRENGDMHGMHFRKETMPGFQIKSIYTYGVPHTEG